MVIENPQIYRGQTWWQIFSVNLHLIDVGSIITAILLFFILMIITICAIRVNEQVFHCSKLFSIII